MDPKNLYFDTQQVSKHIIQQVQTVECKVFGSQQIHGDSKSNATSW